MHNRSPRERPAPRPLDAENLRELALGYAARYATTAAKLAQYLARKLKERGWAGAAPPDVPALVARLAELKYVDDAGWAAMKDRAMAARGLGRRRVAQALHAAGVQPADAPPPPDAAAALAAAITFARRRRLGPFARDAGNDPALRRKQLAAMLRAGHDMAVARQVLAAVDAAALDDMLAAAGD